MRNVLLALSFFLFFNLVVHGQNEDGRLMQTTEGTVEEPRNNWRNNNNEYSGGFQFDLNLAAPQGEFADSYNRDAFFGLAGGISFVIRDTPIEGGLRAGYYWMGRTNEDVRINDSISGDYEVSTTVNGNVIPVHFNARILPLRSISNQFNPYIEGLAGFRIFNIRTKVEVDDLTTGPQPEPEIDRESTVAFSYGYAAGVLIGPINRASLNIRVSRIYGGRATYVDPESI